MPILPYLFFDGTCEEATDYYVSALGAERLDLIRFKDSPEPPPPGMVPPGFETKVMHTTLRIGDALVLASDGGGCVGGKPGMNGFSLSLQLPDEAAVDKAFAGLADGGEVRMPLGPTFFAARFGMVVDRFGVPWMVMVAPAG